MLYTERLKFLIYFHCSKNVLWFTIKCINGKEPLLCGCYALDENYDSFHIMSFILIKIVIIYFACILHRSWKKKLQVNVYQAGWTNIRYALSVLFQRWISKNVIQQVFTFLSSQFQFQNLPNDDITLIQ